MTWAWILQVPIECWILGAAADALSEAFFVMAAPRKVPGVDVDADAVDWCNKHLAQGRFLATASTPPLPYPAEHFDIVYCLSVFTHVNRVYAGYLAG